MEIKVENEKIVEIVSEYLEKKGFTVIKDDTDVKIDMEFEVSDETKPYERIDLPKCSMVDEEDGSYPICMNLVNRRWCNKVGGCC